MGVVVPDVAVDSEDRVYVARRDPLAILVYDREGRYLTSFGESVLSNPHNTWIDPADHLYCADTDDHTVRIFDVEGRFLEAWTDVESPNDIHIDENGIVYVAEAPRRVSLFDLDGRLLARWGEEGDGPDQYVDHPHGICVDSHGDIYVTEVPWQPDRIQKFTRT